MRARWDALLATPEGLALGYPTGDETFIASMFEAAEAFAKDRDADKAAQAIDTLFAASVHRGEAAAPVAAAAR